MRAMQHLCAWSAAGAIIHRTPRQGGSKGTRQCSSSMYNGDEPRSKTTQFAAPVLAKDLNLLDHVSPRPTLIYILHINLRPLQRLWCCNEGKPRWRINAREKQMQSVSGALMVIPYFRSTGDGGSSRPLPRRGDRRGDMRSCRRCSVDRLGCLSNHARSFAR